MVENQIIYVFMLDRATWESYYRFVELSYIRANYPLVYKLFLSLNSYYEKYSQVDTCSRVSLESQYLVLYPMLKETDRKEVGFVLDNIESSEVETATIVALLETHRQRSVTSQIALTALDVSENRKPVEELIQLTELLNKPLDLEAGSDEFETLTMNIEELAESEQLEPGLHWRLTGLNKSLGPLRKGNMGHIFAARETGKSAMWISESLHMVPQLKENQTLDVFFNEEDGKAIIWRMYNCVLKWEYQRVLANPKEAREKFFQAIGGEKIRFFDRASLDRKFIERALEKGNPGLIVVDNMDKVKGWQADRKDQMLHQAYIWARELAKDVAPVLTVGQADATAFNQMWISDAQMAEGKVGKPGETDFTIGIGRTDTSQHPNERFIYISRNKLRGDSNTLEGLRHAKFTAMLQPTYSVYEDGGSHAIR